jgi:cytochrome c biogenesis protein CcdA
MSLTEPTILAGIVTFLFYCVLPLGLLIYMAGSGKRRARRKAADWAAHEAKQAARQAADDDAATPPQD